MASLAGRLSLQRDGRKVLSYLPLSAGHGDVDEAAGVLDALVGAALGGLGLLLGLNLGGLRLDLACEARLLESACGGGLRPGRSAYRHGREIRELFP